MNTKIVKTVIIIALFVAAIIGAYMLYSNRAIYRAPASNAHSSELNPGINE